MTGLAAGSYSDTLVITTANGTANILLKAKVAKSENTASVSLAKKAVSSSSVTVESYVSGTNTGVEYAISTVPVDDADSLTWQDGAYFAGRKAFTKYYVYGRMKATSNLNAGAMSKALEIVTLVSDPYTIDVGRLGNCEYVGALVDGNGNPTQTFLQKTLQGVKNLLHLTDVDNKKKEMSKEALSRIANAVGVSGITISDDGNLTLSAEQAQKLDEALAETSVGSKEEAGQAGQATQQATGVAKELATVKDELAKALKELDEKDEQIKNLQGSSSPKDGTNGNPADQQPALTARAIADSVKGI